MAQVVYAQRMDDQRRSRLGIPDFGPRGFEVGDVLRWEGAFGNTYGVYVRPGEFDYLWIKGRNGEVLVHTGDLSLVDLTDPTQLKEWLHG